MSSRVTQRTHTTHADVVTPRCSLCCAREASLQGAFRLAALPVEHVEASSRRTPALATWLCVLYEVTTPPMLQGPHIPPRPADGRTPSEDTPPHSYEASKSSESPAARTHEHKRA